MLHRQTELEQPKTLEELKEYFYNELDKCQENNINIVEVVAKGLFKRK